MFQTEPIAGIEGVASGADATVKIPSNRRIHKIKLYATGTDSNPTTVYGADVIDRVLVYVGTNLVRTITGAEMLFRYGSFVGRTITPQTDGLALMFTEPQRASVMDAQALAFDLHNNQQMTLKVKIKTGLTAVSLKGLVVYDDGYTTNSEGKRVLNIIKQVVNYVNAGTQYDITQLDTSLPTQRIFLYPESDKKITKVTVKIDDSLVVFERTADENKSFLEDYGLVSGVGDGDPFPIVFDENGQVFDGLPAVKSMIINVEQDDPGAIKILSEVRSPTYA